MSLNNITINGKEYTLVEDEDEDTSVNNGCKDCSFRNDEDRCNIAMHIINCYEKRVHFVPASTIDLRSDTQQIKDWQPTITMQVEDQPIGTKYDHDKLQYSLIPSYALEQIAKNLTVGLKKYKERNNWKKVAGAEQRYLDALYRHLEAHRRGELYDTDSSVPDMLHMAAVAVNAMFLLEFMLDPNLNKKENK
jgi:hypothetical protein